ncbi:helix-turn-helix domain-containing protein [uncultured Desulfovibrio sp.]|uniref:helix-turn-helix domain-containing protein n=1 Tax=uncultured Desulfovibrio sp. TaxID=167968 RepID=UPI0026229271|nr:helix-turn-helix domain-containing protein [uncultured Desulfovibrio sp.]
MTFEELGAALCAERERRGLSLADVAGHLKISTRLIQALEAGDLSALPHPAYTKGFLRAYASYMALEPAGVAEVLHALQPVTTTECVVMAGDDGLRSGHAILHHGARHGLAGWVRIFLLALVLAALAGGGWMLWQQGVFRDLTGGKEQSLPTAEPAAVAPAPVPVSPDQPATPPAAPAAGAQTAPAPQTGSSGAPAAPATGTTPPAAGALPDRSAAPAYTGMMDTRPAELTWGQTANAATVQDAAAADSTLPAGRHRLVVTGIGDCWMRATVDGEVRQFSVRKGDIITLEFGTGLEVKLGNAGGVQLTYDGAELPAPGQTGQVKTLVFPPAAN